MQIPSTLSAVYTVSEKALGVQACEDKRVHWEETQDGLAATSFSRIPVKSPR